MEKSQVIIVKRALRSLTPEQSRVLETEWDDVTFHNVSTKMSKKRQREIGVEVSQKVMGGASAVILGTVPPMVLAALCSEVREHKVMEFERTGKLSKAGGVWLMSGEELVFLT